MKRSSILVYWSLAWLACFCTFGCGNSNEDYKTIQGLQEKNKVLSEQLADLKQNKTASSSELQSQMERLKAAHEDSLTREKELHRTKGAQLEGEIATLRLELGSTQREKIVLQQLVDSKPLIEGAMKVRMGTDIWVLIGFIVVQFISLMLLGYRYKSVNDRLNFLIMQQVGELRRIGGGV